MGNRNLTKATKALSHQALKEKNNISANPLIKTLQEADVSPIPFGNTEETIQATVKNTSSQKSEIVKSKLTDKMTKEGKKSK